MSLTRTNFKMLLIDMACNPRKTSTYILFLSICAQCKNLTTFRLEYLPVQCTYYKLLSSTEIFPNCYFCVSVFAIAFPCMFMILPDVSGRM